MMTFGLLEFLQGTRKRTFCLVRRHIRSSHYFSSLVCEMDFDALLL